MEEVIADVCHWTIEQSAAEQWMVIQTQGQRGERSKRRFQFNQLYILEPMVYWVFQLFGETNVYS